MSGKLVGGNRLDVLVVLPHAGALDRDEDAGAPLERRGVASRRAPRPRRSQRSPRRSLRPCCRSARTTCSSSSTCGRPIESIRGAFAPSISFGAVAGVGRRTASSTWWYRPWNVTCSPASSRRMIVNASSNLRDEMVERQPEGAELDLVPAAAEAEHEPAAGELVRRGRHAARARPAGGTRCTRRAGRARCAR